LRAYSIPENTDGQICLFCVRSDGELAVAFGERIGYDTVAGEWQPVTEENKAQMRFFRVEVVVP